MLLLIVFQFATNQSFRNEMKRTNVREDVYRQQYQQVQTTQAFGNESVDHYAHGTAVQRPAEPIHDREQANGFCWAGHQQLRLGKQGSRVSLHEESSQQTPVHTLQVPLQH
jgi:hypothetical protein